MLADISELWTDITELVPKCYNPQLGHVLSYWSTFSLANTISRRPMSLICRGHDDWRYFNPRWWWWWSPGDCITCNQTDLLWSERQYSTQARVIEGSRAYQLPCCPQWLVLWSCYLGRLQSAAMATSSTTNSVNGPKIITAQVCCSRQ